jgi:hypothetical protein
VLTRLYLFFDLSYFIGPQLVALAYQFGDPLQECRREEEEGSGLYLCYFISRLIVE